MEWSRKTTFVKKGLKRPQGKALNSIRNALLTQRKGPYSFLTVPLCACEIRIFLRIVHETGDYTWFIWATKVSNSCPMTAAQSTFSR